MSDLKCKALALAVASSVSIMAVHAGPITFSPNGDNNAGSLKGEVVLQALGGLPLKSGSASISGKVITIKAGGAYIDTPRTVLVGSVLRTEANLTSDPPNITGLALFLMGDWQDQIDDGASKDMIFRKEGHLDGRILGIENDYLSVNVNGVPQRVPLASILYIRSPRVFVFKIALKSRQPLPKDTVIQAESADSSFRPTVTARTLSGSVIPQSDKKDDGAGAMSSIMGGAAGGLGGTGELPGLSGSNTMGGMGGLSGMNNFNRPGTAIPNQKDDSFDDGDDSNRFSTIHTKWGTQKMTLPPGILD